MQWKKANAVRIKTQKKTAYICGLNRYGFAGGELCGRPEGRSVGCSVGNGVKIGTEGGVIHYPFGTERIEKPAAIGMTGSVLDAALLDDILYLATDEGDHTLFTALSANLSPLWEREMLADAVDWGFGEDCFRLADEEGFRSVVESHGLAIVSAEELGLK